MAFSRVTLFTLILACVAVANQAVAYGGAVTTTNATMAVADGANATMAVADGANATVATNETASAGTGWTRLDVASFEQELLANPPPAGVFLLDVRSDKQWADGHIEGATHIPSGELGAMASALPEDKAKKILVYCNSGNKSQAAAKALIEMGYASVDELQPGIKGWIAEGKPVV